MFLHSVKVNATIAKIETFTDAFIATAAAASTTTATTTTITTTTLYSCYYSSYHLQFYPFNNIQEKITQF